MRTYDPDWVRSYYNQYGSKEWERWDASLVEQVKFEVHLHYLRTHLEANDRILEIGAGPGRFTQHLANISNRIVVADISPAQLQLNCDIAQEMGFCRSVERWVECDVCDLHPHFGAAEFDAVVCYGGPLSYVFDQRDSAISELKRVTRPGGCLLLGVMSLWGTVHQHLPGVLQLDPAVNQDIIATGDLGSTAGTHSCHMYRAAEFGRYLEQAGVAVEVMSASNCLSSTWAEDLKNVRQDEAAWQFLIEMEIEACREPGCLDMGSHLIAVCRVP